MIAGVAKAIKTLGPELKVITDQALLMKPLQLRKMGLLALFYA